MGQYFSSLPCWAAANGGVTNGGLRGVWPPFLEIGRNRPFSPFCCPFRPFPEGTKSTWEIQKTEEKGLFPQISSDLLKPPSLKPPFAALQPWAAFISVFFWSYFWSANHKVVPFYCFRCSSCFQDLGVLGLCRRRAGLGKNSQGRFFKITSTKVKQPREVMFMLVLQDVFEKGLYQMFNSATSLASHGEICPPHG